MSDRLEDTGKSPDVDSLGVINTIKNSNTKLLEMLENGKVFGIPSTFFLNLQQKWRKKNGLNQMDRHVLLRSIVKSVLNMIPVNFEDFHLQALDIL